MPYRSYIVNQKYIKNKRGDIGHYKKIIKKWIKSNIPYKRQIRGWEKQSIHSIWFGFLEVYNRKEQQQLICPSGHSISQCFNVLRKMWYAYHKSRHDEKNYYRMLKYAKAIQNVQKDMGIKTTSFPHLGLYGDVLVLKNEFGELVVEDHSALKKSQEERKRRIAQMLKTARMSKMIRQKLQQPDARKGEKIKAFADDFGPSYIDPKEHEVTVPDLLKADVKVREVLIRIPDNIPFRAVHRPRNSRPIPQKPMRPHRRKCESLQMPARQKLQRPDARNEEIKTFADDFGPPFIDLEEHEVPTPELQADVETEEELIRIPDNIPFRAVHRPRNSRPIQQKPMWPHRRKCESITTFADDVSPYQMIKEEREDVVRHLTEPDENHGEKRVIFPDNTPFEY